MFLPNTKRAEAQRGLSVTPLGFSSFREGVVVQAHGYSNLGGKIQGVRKDFLATKNLDGSAWQSACFLLVLRAAPTVHRDSLMGTAALLHPPRGDTSEELSCYKHRIL